MRKQYLHEDEHEKFEYVENLKKLNKRLAYVHHRKDRTTFVEEFFKARADWVVLNR